MIIKDKDGKEIVLQMRGDTFVCPCCSCDVAPIKCVGPECPAMVPSKYCANCGYCMGFGNCETCGQPEAGAVATDANKATANAVADAVAAVVAEQLPAIVASVEASEPPAEDGGMQMRATPEEGIVEGYFTSRTFDKHKSRISTTGLLRFAAQARIDINHSCKPVDGISIVSAVPVMRNIAGEGLVEAGHLTVKHDLSVPAARAEWENVKAGKYSDFSPYFYITKAKDAQIRAGIPTDVGDEDIYSMPFISYVPKGSNRHAPIAHMRSDPDAPALESAPVDPLASTAERFRAIKAAATAVPEQRSESTPEAPANTPVTDPTPPEEPAYVQQMRSELVSLTATVEQTRQATLGAVSAFMNDEIAPVMDAMQATSRSELAQARADFKAELAAQARSFHATLTALRVAEPTHDAGIQPDAVPAARSETPAKTDASARTRFPAIPMNLSRD